MRAREHPAQRASSPPRLIFAINFTLDSSILKLCNQQVEDILLELSLDSAPSSFTQMWQLPKTDNSYNSVQNAVKSAELYHKQVLTHFLFLDNNGDELAEHWWPLEDTRCKRLTDPPCHFNLLRASLRCVFSYSSSESLAPGMYSWSLKDTRCKSQLTLPLPTERQKV